MLRKRLDSESLREVRIAISLREILERATAASSTSRSDAIMPIFGVLAGCTTIL